MEGMERRGEGAGMLMYFMYSSLYRPLTTHASPGARSAFSYIYDRPRALAPSLAVKMMLRNATRLSSDCCSKIYPLSYPVNREG